jgi:uncharacterized membrane protein YphA (DoxX/SURF4 family)
VERYFGWLLVTARLLVPVVFLLNGFGIIDQTIPAREMLERGVPAEVVPLAMINFCKNLAIWGGLVFIAGTTSQRSLLPRNRVRSESSPSLGL